MAYKPKIQQRSLKILGTPTPWVFILGAVAIGLLSDGVSELIGSLSNRFILALPWMKVLLGLVLLLIAFLLFDLRGLAKWLAKAFGKEASVVINDNVPPHHGLIALVSLGQGYESTEAAIQHHLRTDDPEKRLKYCWLLAGPGEGETSSIANANFLKGKFEEEGVKVEIWKLTDADNPSEVFCVINRIYKDAAANYNLPNSELIADFTGATKSMTAGMVLACADQNRDMQFMKPSEYDQNGRAKFHTPSYAKKVDIEFFASTRSPEESKQ